MEDGMVNWGAVQARLALNLKQTGHPFHHLTLSGAIINCDPRIDPDDLEDSVLEHLWIAGFPMRSVPKAQAHPRRAVPLVPDWYDTEAGRRWLKKHSTAHVVQAAPPRQPSLWD